ncbi:carboxypeptidase-like regulatory domain-containing protein [Actinoplanes sp. CA-142083]|uniref:carboxypeptidase-like regulatory domain-containing protein n=1 Tax=Actinoplanes sp. CA-142083 TaxID=3239903 RepID=UPI003D90414A
MRPIRMITTVTLAAAIAATGVATPALADTGTGSISGSVRDTKGAVVANSEITVYPPTQPSGPVAVTHTDAAGKFRVTGLDEGSYQIQIGLGGWTEWAPGRVGNPADARTYTVAAGRTTRATSVVTAAGVVTGRVTTPAGRPAAGIAVSADDDNQARTWNTTTAADGTYSLKVPPGDAYVIGFQDGNLRQYSPRTLDRTQARHYTVRSGRTLRVDDQLLAAASLTGRLTDATGAPAAGAQVHFIDTTTAYELVSTTDADGRYRFEKLSPAEIKVWFRTADGQEQWAHQALSYDEAATFTLSLGAVTTVDDQLLPL